VFLQGKAHASPRSRSAHHPQEDAPLGGDMQKPVLGKRLLHTRWSACATRLSAGHTRAAFSNPCGWHVDGRVAVQPVAAQYRICKNPLHSADRAYLRRPGCTAVVMDRARNGRSARVRELAGRQGSRHRKGKEARTTATGPDVTGRAATFAASRTAQAEAGLLRPRRPARRLRAPNRSLCVPRPCAAQSFICIRPEPADWACPTRHTLRSRRGLRGRARCGGRPR